MGDTPPQDPEVEPPEDRTNETLTPQEAYTLREQGLRNKTVAKMFGVSEGYVSQLYGQYKEAQEEGRESVTPSDFSREELEEAIADNETDSPYHIECPACGDQTAKPETPGQHPCDSCGAKLQWDESEI